MLLFNGLHRWHIPLVEFVSLPQEIQQVKKHLETGFSEFTFSLAVLDVEYFRI